MANDTSQENPYYKETRLTLDTIWDLDRLFDAAPPGELRDHILEVYHTYVIHTHDALPMNFDQIAINLYHLIQCLGDLEKDAREHVRPG